MNTIIVDGNSIGHANHSGARLSVGDFEVQMIFGMLKSIRTMAQSYPSWKIIVVWDGEQNWRKEYYADYKANRIAKTEQEQKDKDSYKKQVPFARKALQLMGVPQMYATTHEADDVAGMLIIPTVEAGNNVVLATGDGDWKQYVSPQVMWFDPIRDRTVNHSTFFECTGYRTPRQFVQGKALMGDISDNIPGVGKIGEKSAPEVLAEFGSVEEFWRQVDSGEHIPRLAKMKNLALPETREIFQRNMKLMSLLDAPRPNKEDIVVIKPTLDPGNFRRLCETLSFRSITRDMDGFLEPFERNKAA